MNVSARRLFRAHPSSTGAAQVFPASGTATQVTEFTRIFVANTDSSTRTFRLYHDDTGTTYSAATALYYDVSVPANSTIDIASQVPSGGITVSIGGTLGFDVGTANTITITGYGQLLRGR